jgi:two-component system cell cycle sensor histidine kinase/response regulator CckA
VDLFHENPNPMWIYDTETLRFLDVNESAIHAYGWSREEFLSMTILEIRPPEEFQAVRSNARRNDPIQSSGPWRHRYKDGSERLVRITSHAVEFNSRPARAVTVTDVTDSVRATEALRISEAGLRALTDRLPVALLYIDAQGNCRSANRAFEDWFNISRDEIVQHNFEFFIRRGDGMQYEADVRRSWSLALNGQASSFEKVIHIHGRKRNIEASYTPDFDAEGQVCGVIVLLHDITDRRALEEQFRHAQKMEAIGRLAGGIAHDFNNILSVINGYAGILQQELKENPRLGHMASEIHRSGERAARLTQQLLAFSRKQVSQPRVVRLADLLKDDEVMLRRLMGEDVRLEIKVGPETAAIEMDPHRFSQVLMNLAVNARDAMPKGGTLTIAGWADQQNARISVQDTGCGMSAEVREHLFEPFFTTKEPGKGTGLGLATVYGIVRDAGGSVTVRSAEGKGSTFIITLPLAQQNAVETPAPSANGMYRGKETILLIEDDPNVRYLIAYTLKSCGYTVIEAANGADGLAIARELLPSIDAVISDAIMPKLGGQELIVELRRLRPDLKAMLVSGHIDADPKDVSTDPQTKFLYKPVPPQTLTAELRRLLDAVPVASQGSLE